MARLIMNTTNLETRIASALTNADITSRDLASLLTALEAGISVADEAAEAAREKALDPIVSPDAGKAEQSAWAAKLNRDRLRSFLARVRQRLDEVEAAEYAARWQADYEAVEAKRDAIAKEMAELYPSFTTKLCDLFQRAEAIDQECLRINGKAPTGEHRRLRGVELTARNFESFSRSDPSIIDLVKLPDWTHRDRMIWPPLKTPLSVLVAASMTPPPDPRFSPTGPRRVSATTPGVNRRKNAGPKRRQTATQREGVFMRPVCDNELSPLVSRLADGPPHAWERLLAS
jgi:hypothetical protein